MKERPKTKEDYPLILTADDVAEILRISKPHAYEVMKRSGLILDSPGRSIRIPRERFFKWIYGED